MLTLKKHFINLLGYLAIGFIAGAISHGFFSGTRSIIMASIGVILFIISEYLQAEKKSYLELIVFGLMYSLAVGMVSGGLQHFLDSPARSLWIIPLGYLISLLVYPYKEGLHGYNLKQSLIWGVLISMGLYAMAYLLLHVVPEEYFMNDHHMTDTMLPGLTDTPGDLINHDSQTLQEFNGDDHNMGHNH